LSLVQRVQETDLVEAQREALLGPYLLRQQAEDLARLRPGLDRIHYDHPFPELEDGGQLEQRRAGFVDFDIGGEGQAHHDLGRSHTHAIVTAEHVADAHEQLRGSSHHWSMSFRSRGSG
jgi:hypothetical protein